MEVIEQGNTLRSVVQAIRCSGKSIGFVPTMGALHEGHLQLLRASVQQNDITVCSIFINPIQFNNSSDYDLYPRTMTEDIALLETVGCDFLFAPAASDIYPEQSLLRFSFGELEGVMEGVLRPGHFSGVATVVSKFFNLVQPHRAYFGQKDLQQVAIVRQVVVALGFDLELVCSPTVREEDGLAMSSRNKRLDPEQRRLAVNLYRVLQQARAQLATMPVEAIKQKVADTLHLSDLIKLDYFEVADPRTLQPVTDLREMPEVALCIAAYVGPVRLIDNLIVNLKEV